MDFSKHVYTVSLQTGTYSLETEPGKLLYAVHFRNMAGKCLVTGDFGSWVFSRQWHPAQEYSVSAHYFREKVESKPCSIDRLGVYNPAATRVNVQECDELTPEQVTELVAVVEDEEEFIELANGIRRHLAEELVSYGLEPWLATIHQALEEMILRAAIQKEN